MRRGAAMSGDRAVGARARRRGDAPSQALSGYRSGSSTFQLLASRTTRTLWRSPPPE
jgi:hypothetical protein